MIVPLTAGEIRVAALLVRVRAGENRSAGVVDTMRGQFEDFDGETIGVLGEWTFAKAVNVCPDLTTHPRRGGYDMLAAGLRVDVKSTRRRDGDLMVPRPNDAVDVYVSVIVRQHEAEIVGWASKDEVFRDENRKNPKHGECWVVQRYRLHPFVLEYWRMDAILVAA